MKKYKVTIEEEITIEAEDENDAVFQALDGFDFGNIKPYVEEIEEGKQWKLTIKVGNGTARGKQKKLIN
jgi:hypothetical protein